MLLPETLKRLVELLADGRFHSGGELAGILGISRTAVWKQLQAFPQLGLELTAVSGKGYKLRQPLQLLDAPSINARLSPPARNLLKRLDVFDVIPSTNTYLLECAKAGGESGWACLAESQTAGRGRRGRTWVSPFGSNLYLSVLWRYPDGPGAIAGLSLAAGVAVAQVLSAFGLAGIALKWPNDVYGHEGKLAGILVEVSGESCGPCHAVIGVGVNIYLPARQAQAIEQPWTHITGMLGASAYTRRNELAAGLLDRLLPVVAGYRAENTQGYAEQWRNYDGMSGRAATVVLGDRCYEGTVAGIDDDGRLLLSTGEGRIMTFASGDVSLRAS